VTIYADLLRYRELFASLFRRDLRAKYKGSVLGVVWSLAHPVLLMLVYLVVFSLLLKVQAADYEHYWLFLLAGLPAWVFFATSLQSASRSLVENANLIRKVRFPRQLVPLSMVATQLVSFGVCLVAGVALAVASLNALYRDVEHVVAALLLPWFFLTPVLYSLEDVPGGGNRLLVELIHYGNFLTPAVESLRDPIFFGRLPAGVDVAYLAVAAVSSLALGAFVFTRVDDRVAVEA
jgi:ABC-2 type transport system permease protein